MAGVLRATRLKPPCSATVGVRLMPDDMRGSDTSSYERDSRLIFGE
jgi:hypothetical protein